MTFVLIVLFVLILSKATYAEKNGFNKDYISKDSTTAINGIFVILVFLRHFAQYFSLDSASDAAFIEVNNFLNQLIVVPFLFFSGYGTMLSIMKKGTPYVKNLFKGRFLKILFHFDICVLLFLILDILLGKEYSLKQTSLAFTTWTSIGNSNWYITAVLSFYLIAIVSFLLIRKHHFPALLLFTALTIGLVYFNIKVGRDAYFYNTMITFPLGMWYAYFKPTIDKLVMKNNINYTFCLAAASFCFLIAFKYRFEGVEFFAIWSGAFAIIITLLSMKIKVNNPILIFFGEHVFSIYILQRLPMMVLRQLNINTNSFVLFFVLFAITLFIALIFDTLMKKFDGVLFDRKKLESK
ncbi:MAG: acyltransferase family protein [Eubacterium sp.]|nr:acyltransferase family protein [Eubacterium sp.]